MVCGDLKITDLALVYLTFCLVVFGWYQMRHADATTRRSERAYFVAGALYGQPRNDGDEWSRSNQPTAKMFKGPWRLTIYNFGRTAGFTTGVEWGLCPEEKFPRDVRVSRLLDDGLLAEYMKEPVTLEDVFAPTGNTPYQYRHVQIDRDAFVGYILFGRMSYKDVFGDDHFSTFSYRLTEDYSDAIGNSLSDDHA
jgi:hypothetical protein